MYHNVSEANSAIVQGEWPSGKPLAHTVPPIVSVVLPICCLSMGKPVTVQSFSIA